MVDRAKRGSRRDDERPDTLTLTTGLIALAVSVYLFVGVFGQAHVLWALPPVGVGIGIVLLITSVFPRRR